MSMPKPTQPFFYQEIQQTSVRKSSTRIHFMSCMEMESHRMHFTQHRLTIRLSSENSQETSVDIESYFQEDMENQTNKL
jgi:hypothetical protein